MKKIMLTYNQPILKQYCNRYQRLFSAPDLRLKTNITYNLT